MRKRIVHWMIKNGWLHQNPWTKEWFFGAKPNYDASKSEGGGHEAYERVGGGTQANHGEGLGASQ